ncbi:hypothetical protein G6F53_013939 [Rhizopus delemar]|nr:hypothetical protein G6F53_013939 [Rhizopus delemar]
MNTSPVPCTDGGIAISGWVTTLTLSRVTTASCKVPGAAAIGAALVTTIHSGPCAINSRAASTTSSIDARGRPTSSSSSKWFGVMPSANGTSKSRYCATSPASTYRPSLRSPITGSICTRRSGRAARTVGSPRARKSACPGWPR